MTKNKQVKKAIIPVAGLGTRFLPFTKAVPKEMLPIVDKPTIQYIVQEAVDAGIEEIIFITASGKDSVIDHFDRNIHLENQLMEKDKASIARELKKISQMVRIFTVRQHEQLGLGHAVLQAKAFIGDEPFALLLGDDVIYNPETPALKQLIQKYDETGASVLGVQEVPEELVSNYGVIDPEKQLDDNTWKLKGVVEKPKREEAPSNYTIMGRYVLDGKIFDYLAEKNVDKATNEIQITDSILRLMEEGEVIGYKFEGRRYDMGSRIGFIQANLETALRDPELHQQVVDLFNSYNEETKEFKRVK